MANDFQKKEPTKSERMIYELAMNQQHLERSMWSTSAHVVALGLVLGADPAKVAEMLVNGDEKIKEYSKVVNDKIAELEKAKKPHDPETDPKIEAAPEVAK